MATVNSPVRPTLRPDRANPHAYRVAAAVMAVLVLILSTVVLVGYYQARRIPESTGGPSAPTLTRIPSLGLTIPTKPIAEEGAVLDPPSNPREAGWWSNGAIPGGNQGTVIITAHKIHGGGGAFDDLADIKRGALITVDTQLGVQNYEVMDVTHYDRTEFAAKAPEIFTTEGDTRLALITCRDWNGKDWDGNTVVMARPGVR